MRIEVGPVAPEVMQGDDAAGADVRAVKECLVTAEQTETGSWQVTLDVRARKVVVAETGV